MNLGVKYLMWISFALVILLLLKLILTVHKLERDPNGRSKYHDLGDSKLGNALNSVVKNVGLRIEPVDTVPIVSNPSLRSQRVEANLAAPQKERQTQSGRIIGDYYNNIKPTKIIFVNPQIAKSDVKSEITQFKQFGELNMLTNSSYRNLVLALGYKTSDESIAILLGSMKKRVQKADAVLFVNAPVSARCLEIAYQSNAVIVEYNSSKLAPKFIEKYHPSTFRWILFHQFLSQFDTNSSLHYEKVLFADARDVVFEDDPFIYLPENVSYVFQEGVDTGTPISQCGWNSAWIKDCMGPKMLLAVQNNNIICSGVSIMSYQQGRQYLSLMTSIMLGHSEISRKFPACERNGVDQGVHNVIVHLDLVPGLQIMSEINFPVVNIQNSPVWNNPDLRLVDLDMNIFDSSKRTKKKYAVVHQFDRLPKLTLEISKVYVYWKDYSNMQVMWKNEPSCNKYDIFVGDDLYRGQCDIGGARVFSPDQCCSLCNNMAKCHAFAFSESVCYFKSCNATSVEIETRKRLDAARISPFNWRLNQQNTSKDALIVTAFT